MASVYSDLSDVSRSMAKDVCENEKIQKFVSGVAPYVVGGIVKTVAGEPAGEITKAAASGLSRSHGREVAEFFVGAGVSMGLVAASIVATPFVAAAVAYAAGRGLLKMVGLISDN